MTETAMAPDWILTGSKCLVRVDTPLLGGWEDCGTLKRLQGFVVGDEPAGVSEGLSWKGGTIPEDMMKDVLGTIAEFPNKETGYVLQYRVSDRSWRIACPRQRGSGGSVSFQAEEPTDGYAEIGTIHTHPNMSAFWSGTDMNDQRSSYGLHIVFGLRGGLVHESKCSIFAPSAHYDIDIKDVVGDLKLDEKYPPREDWVDVIKKSNAEPETKFQWNRNAAGLGKDYQWPRSYPRGSGVSRGSGESWEDDLDWDEWSRWRSYGGDPRDYKKPAEEKSARPAYLPDSRRVTELEDSIIRRIDDSIREWCLLGFEDAIVDAVQDQTGLAVLDPGSEDSVSDAIDAIADAVYGREPVQVLTPDAQDRLQAQLAELCEDTESDAPESTDALTDRLEHILSQLHVRKDADKEYLKTLLGDWIDEESDAAPERDDND